MEQLLFIKEFFKNWRQVGTVTQSSRFLVRKIIEPIDLEKAKLIVELGPGTGPVTRGLLAKMRKDAMLVAVEVNEHFCKQLHEIKDPRLVVIQGSAFELDRLLKGMKADAIVSGIPLTVLSRSQQAQLMRAAVSVLKPDGKFVQFQYSLSAHKMLTSVFADVATDFTFLNTPPAFIYRCGNAMIGR